MATTLIEPGDQLLRVIRQNLESSSEAIILAALITESGVQSIIKSLKHAIGNRSIIKVIFGTGMPASSSHVALRKLFELHDDEQFRLLWYKGRSFFHPKVMLFRKGTKWSILLGSSNFTEGGFRNNIEFNFYLGNLETNNTIIKDLRRRIKQIEIDSGTINEKWLERYKNRCEKIRNGQAQLKNATLSLRGALLKTKEIEIRQWNQLVKAAISFKQSKDYKERLDNIPEAIQKCKKTIGSASTPKVVVERWSSKSNLGLFGTMDSRQFTKTIPNTRAKLQKLNQALRYLLNEKTPISTRLSNMLNKGSHYHVDGMGISMISDILNKYYPRKYIVYNNPIVAALRAFGIRYLPSDEAEAYLRVLGIYHRLRQAAKYPSEHSFALLDQFMWIKGHKLLYG